MRRLHKPSPALVISLVALFVALGGTSYAISSIPNNSVGTKQLKRSAVTTQKIHKHAVTASKINTAGLTAPHAGTARIGDSPAAWAEVSKTGKILASRGVSASNITVKFGNTYCFSGLSVRVKSATVTPDFGPKLGPGYGAELAVPASSDCPGAQAEVAPWKGKIDVAASFFIQFFS